MAEKSAAKAATKTRRLVHRDVLAQANGYRGVAWYEQGGKQITVALTRPLRSVLAANRSLARKLSHV